MPDNSFRRAAARGASLANRLVPAPRVRFWLATAIKLTALPLLMLLCVWLYTLGLEAALRLIPTDYPGRRFLVYGSLIAQGFLPACLVAGVLCYPLALCYRRFALPVALMCCLPHIVIWALLNPYDSENLIGGVLSAYNQICLLVLVIVGTWVARASLLRRQRNELPTHRCES